MDGGRDGESFCFSCEPSLEEIRRRQTEFTAERDWERFHKPRSLLLALVGEVGELAELFQWKEEVLPGLPGWRPQERARVADELADVLIYLTELAAVCHVDLPRAVLTKMAQNACKYPAEKKSLILPVKPAVFLDMKPINMHLQLELNQAFTPLIIPQTLSF